MITVERVANASRGELLCITYELLMESIEKIDLCEKVEEKEKYKHRVLEIIKMLIGDLDFNYELAKPLFHIYIYIQKLIIQGKSKAEYEEAYKLIEKIHKAYQEAALLDADQTPVMKNVQSVYTGYTYGLQGVSEISSSAYTRGMKA